MDGGRANISDKEYETYHQRFRRIFRYGSGEPPPTHYLPGNHDIGMIYNEFFVTQRLGTSVWFSDRADERYTSHFGPQNQIIDVENHTLVLIDAPSLVEEEEERTYRGQTYELWAAHNPKGTVAFLRSLGSQQHSLSTVLFTHIPLARPDDAPCGPLRERGTIRSGRGFGYQNTLAPQTSQFLLQTTRPSLVLSGDDHDYCEYEHTYNDIVTETLVNVTEVTVKTFSMAMGVRIPGFELLSLSPNTQSSVEAVATSPCFLPDQLGIYLSTYVPFVIFSLLLLFVSNAHRVRTRGRFVSWAPLPLWLQSLPRGCAVTARGRRLRVTFPLQELVDVDRDETVFATKTESRMRARRGLLHGWLAEVVRVAWMPLICFVIIAWHVS
ncbi:uncharacterized protein FIBRA_05449 [Fibroporia radiculosa]|uniref:Calcineurin-like phosphoesterase domain-containing protein n=1 Tax=Fibroporia radiculosa TaxID=599839 RepID=J4IAQ5_9APHY|nr:uncharacterized protein FIBRA_05449 [Fibroporia radiculosa]CCM03321.1 predicted protein [Fibroporia radiculosa]